MESFDSEHVPVEWRKAAQRLAGGIHRSVCVIGPIDSGKSTLARFLFASALRAGSCAALIDADLGQKIVGPPACVTRRDSTGEALAFVGTTDPVLGWQRLLAGTKCLMSQSGAELRIVNTDGLLAGPGPRLKAAMLDAVRPDLLIVLGEAAALEAIAAGYPTLRLPSSPMARRKTEGERRALRREAFRRYFEAASVITAGRHRLLTDEHEPLASGLLLGLCDSEGRTLGIGLLAKDSADAALDILTPVDGSLIHRITPGILRLDQNFSELRAPRKAFPTATSLL